MKLYCRNCKKEQEFIPGTKEFTKIYKGVEVTFIGHIVNCSVCGEEIRLSNKSKNNFDVAFNNKLKSMSKEEAETTMRKRYCEHCDDWVEADMLSRDMTTMEKGVEITHVGYYAVCPQCGKEFYDSEMRRKNIVNLTEAYEKKADELKKQSAV